MTTMMEGEEVLWFGGTVADAVALVQGIEGVLLAVLEDGSESSNAFVGNWESDNVASFIKTHLRDKVVCLRVKEDTEDGTDLKTAFASLEAPCAILFETASKSILKLFNHPCTQEEILSSLSSLCVENYGTPQESKVDQSATPQQHAHKSVEERQEEIAAKLREARKKKANQRMEEEKKKEIQRRQDQKAMLQARKTVEQKQMEEAIKERQVEKQKRKYRYATVKKKIEEDRERRKLASTMESTSPQAPISSISSRKPPQQNFAECKVSLRMPDSSSQELVLSSKASVAELYTQVRQLIGDGHEIVIKTPPPTTELNPQDETSMFDLGFCPRVRLIIRLRPLPPPQVSMCDSVVKFVYAIFCSPKPSDEDDQAQNSTQPMATTSNTPQSPSSSSSTESNVPQSFQPRDASSIRQRRIAHLSDLNKGNEDEDNTNDGYNGNSTQFHM
eukprot:m.3777 g.3777  ORF g.3777 m.3777 type:complete len:446 (+) comp2123_c0_seq1:73-1410(+)